MCICFHEIYEVQEMRSELEWSKQQCGYSHSFSEVLHSVGQNFLVDYQFCKTYWSSINNRLVENIFTINLPYSP